MSQNPSPVNQAAASAASPPPSSELIDAPSPVNHELPVDAEEEVAPEQQPPLDGADVEEGGDDDNDNEYISVDLRELRSNLECPICLGIVKKCRTIAECLHRFCKDCIEKALRIGRNECPACHIHCPSRRSLREDPTFDTLISILIPDIEKFEEEKCLFLRRRGFGMSRLWQPLLKLLEGNKKRCLRGADTREQCQACCFEDSIRS